MSNFIASVVALGLLYIAWRQWKTNQQKLNLDLFDRRFKVWEAMVKITDIVENLPSLQRLDRSELAEFAICSTSVIFLFGDEMRGHMEKLLLAIDQYRVTRNSVMYNKWVTENKDRVRDLFRQKMDFSKI